MSSRWSPCGLRDQSVGIFYLGQLLKIDPLIDSDSVELEEIRRSRLRSHIANGWHTSCIRIFGDFQRRMAVLNDGNKTFL